MRLLIVGMFHFRKHKNSNKNLVTREVDMVKYVKIIIRVFFLSLIASCASGYSESNSLDLEGSWKIQGDETAQIYITELDNKGVGIAILKDNQRTNNLKFKILKYNSPQNFIVLSIIKDEKNKFSNPAVHLSVITGYNSTDSLKLTLYYKPYCIDFLTNKKLLCSVISARLWQTEKGNVEIVSDPSKELILGKVSRANTLIDITAPEGLK